MMDTQDDAALLIDAVTQGQSGQTSAALQAVLNVCAKHEADPVVRELAAQVLAASGLTSDAARLRIWTTGRGNAPRPAPDPALRAMFGQFESLGEDAEFGLVQSHFGAEPASPLHGCVLSFDRLIALLEQRFARLGDDGATRLDLSVTREWWLTDTHHGLVFPTFVHESEGKADHILAEQSRLLRLRCSALLAAMENGGTVAVIKSIAPVKSGMTHRLNLALRSCGGGWSLVVTKADAFNHPGTIRLLHDRMLIGFISALNPLLAGDPHASEIRYDEWRAICETALAMRAGKG